LATGRTHQIRVHLAARGHPLIGDSLYLRRVPSEAKAAPAGLRGQLLDFPRQALHAASLGFTHPRTGEKLSFRADLPPDLASMIDAIDENLTGG
jgi:23S rRNA pseudouridine1911/1915/1917 synthase